MDWQEDDKAPTVAGCGAAVRLQTFLLAAPQLGLDVTTLVDKDAPQSVTGGSALVIAERRKRGVLFFRADRADLNL